MALSSQSKSYRFFIVIMCYPKIQYLTDCMLKSFMLVLCIHQHLLSYLLLILYLAVEDVCLGYEGNGQSER